jgi:hypothetical protein
MFSIGIFLKQVLLDKERSKTSTWEKRNNNFIRRRNNVIKANGQKETTTSLEEETQAKLKLIRI